MDNLGLENGIVDMEREESTMNLVVCKMRMECFTFFYKKKKCSYLESNCNAVKKFMRSWSLFAQSCKRKDTSFNFITTAKRIVFRTQSTYLNKEIPNETQHRLEEIEPTLLKQRMNLTQHRLPTIFLHFFFVTIFQPMNTQ